MSEMTAEQFAQKAYHLDLVSEAELSRAWAALGTRNVSREDLIAELQRSNILTNFQTDRIIEGRQEGYFYGDWKVLYMVGAGTFARVYRAVHKTTGDVKAVKVLRRRYSEDVNATEQFLHEAKMVMKLKHPNVVPVYEVTKARQHTYMVMEFVEGRNLRDFVKIRSNFSLEESVRIGLDITNGMDFAFMHGVLHRDMKLSNILLAAAGRAMLVDFGLAAMEQLKNADGSSNPRSVDYVALEKITNVRRGDKRSDIYFLGGILYQLLCGKSPWPETMDRIQRMSPQRFHDVRPLAEVDARIPNRLSSIVSRAMELHPDKRYQQPSELKRDLETTLDMIRRGGLDQAPGVTAPGLGQQPEVYEGDGRTVMLVDNHPEMQDLLRDGLKKRGYRVLIIGNPERALDRFQDGSFRVDALLLNASRLGQPALQLAKTLVGGDLGVVVPVIVLTAPGQAEALGSVPGRERVRALPMPVRLSQIRQALLEVMPKPDDAAADPAR